MRAGESARRADSPIGELSRPPLLTKGRFVFIEKYRGAALDSAGAMTENHVLSRVG